MREAGYEGLGTLAAYKQRWKRRWLRWRCVRARHARRVVEDRSMDIAQGEILGFACVRNEIERLPFWLYHHRNMGVSRFLIVDNASTDGTAEMLADQPDVSLWRTERSYRSSRFGMDWVGWLLLRYGHGHWCLTLDADELLTIPYQDTRTLYDLTAHLDMVGARSFGAMMLDL